MTCLVALIKAYKSRVADESSSDVCVFVIKSHIHIEFQAGSCLLQRVTLGFMQQLQHVFEVTVRLPLQQAAMDS